MRAWNAAVAVCVTGVYDMSNVCSEGDISAVSPPSPQTAGVSRPRPACPSPAGS